MLGAREEKMEDFEDLWQALDEAAEQHEAERKKAVKEAKIQTILKPLQEQQQAQTQTAKHDAGPADWTHQDHGYHSPSCQLRILGSCWRKPCEKDPRRKEWDHEKPSQDA